ncbi:MAG TPA: hypothetical protein VGO47_14020 [Chlamydiales bacterium]|nr:hypothetical protein [Chlamydiales bacterium]
MRDGDGDVRGYLDWMEIGMPPTMQADSFLDWTFSSVRYDVSDVFSSFSTFLQPH